MTRNHTAPDPEGCLAFERLAAAGVVFTERGIGLEPGVDFAKTAIPCLRANRDQKQTDKK
jgi:hypothetical protein